jgi:hypothetical protein
VHVHCLRICSVCVLALGDKVHDATDVGLLLTENEMPS